MTCVIVWHNKEEGRRVWAVADTRISQETKLPYIAPQNSSLSEQGRLVTLLDEGPKIYELLLEVRQPDDSGFCKKLIHSQRLGLAYAGNSLIANNVYIAIAPLLRSLITTSNESLSLLEIATWIAGFAEAYVRSRNFNGDTSRPAVSEFALFGSCPRSRKLEIIHIKPSMANSSFSMQVVPFLPSDDAQCLVLGDHVEHIHSSIENARRSIEKKGLHWWRAPMLVLDDTIKHETFDSIGGAMQIAIATEDFSFSLFRPVESDWPRPAQLLYLGLEMEKLGVLGKCQVGLPGIGVYISPHWTEPQ